MSFMRKLHVGLQVSTRMSCPACGLTCFHFFFEKTLLHSPPIARRPLALCDWTLRRGLR